MIRINLEGRLFEGAFIEKNLKKGTFIREGRLIEPLQYYKK